MLVPAVDDRIMLHELFSFCALAMAGAAGALLSKPTTAALVRVVARRPRR